MKDWYLMIFLAVVFASACTHPNQNERSIESAELYETPAQMPSAESADSGATSSRSFSEKAVIATR